MAREPELIGGFGIVYTRIRRGGVPLTLATSGSLGDKQYVAKPNAQRELRVARFLVGAARQGGCGTVTNVLIPEFALCSPGGRAVAFFEYFEEDLLGAIQNPRHRGALSRPGPVAQLVLEIHSGLVALHALGVVHGDIKVENVVCRRAGARWEVRLIDLGGAHCGSRDADCSSECTLRHVSPRRWRGGLLPSVDDDFYALGAVLFVIVVQKLFFGYGSDFQYDVLVSVIDPMSQLDGGASARIGAELERLLPFAVRQFEQVVRARDGWCPTQWSCTLRALLFSECPPASSGDAPPREHWMQRLACEHAQPSLDE